MNFQNIVEKYCRYDIIKEVVDVRKLQILLIILCLFMITGCKKNDAVLFKEEYENLNKEDGYRSVTIPKDNPFVYISDEELAEKIENREDMVVYFGFNTCPWCRSIIENLIQVASDLKIKKIYYLDVLDIRDKKEINDGKIETVKEGSKGYNKIVELLGNHISDYTVDNQVVGKRIYAPNILIIKEQEIYDVIEGVSDMETDPMMELTPEINKDSYNKIYDLLEKYTKTVCSAGSC